MDYNVSGRIEKFFWLVKVKVKWSRYRPGVAQRVGRGIALLFHDRGTRRGWVVSSTFRPHFTSGKKPGTHFTGGWVGPRAGLDRAENLVPTGIRSRTFQPVVSRYTDWATGPTPLIGGSVNGGDDIKKWIRKVLFLIIFTACTSSSAGVTFFRTLACF